MPFRHPLFRILDQSHSNSGQDLTRFSRFVVAGLVNTVASFLLFLVFHTGFGWNYILSNILVFMSWLWFGFEVQRRFAFRAKRSRDSFVKFGLNQLVFVGLGTLILWILVEFGTLDPRVAYVLTISLVTAGVYFSSLLWVFRPAK